MKVRDNTLYVMHQGFVQSLDDWQKKNTLSQYILRRGLVHVWINQGKEECRALLLNIPFFVQSYQEQDWPIWLLETWYAITRKEVEHHYLDQIEQWNQEDCVQKADILEILQEIFQDFGWNDPNCILEEKELFVLQDKYGKDHWESKHKQAFLDYVQLEPHDARQKIEEFLAWAEQNCPDKETILYTLGKLSDLCLREGNLSLAVSYVDRITEYVAEVYSDEAEQFDFLQKSVEIYEEVGEIEKASKIMERWFQLCCADVQEKERYWAEDVMKMAEFIEYDQPIRAIDLYEQAISILKQELGSIHPTTQDAIRNQAIVYGQNGQHLQGIQSLNTLIDAVCERYGAYSTDAMNLRIDQAMIYKTHLTEDYVALEICEDVIESVDKEDCMLDQDEKDNIFERAFFFYASTVKDFDTRGVDISPETKQKAMTYFHKYCSLIEQNYTEKSLEYVNLPSQQCDFFLWNDQYEDVLEILDTRLQLAKAEFGDCHKTVSDVYYDYIKLYNQMEEWPKAYEKAELLYHLNIELYGEFSEFSSSDRYELFYQHQKLGYSKKKLKKFIKDWYKEAKSNLEEDAEEWVHVYSWLSEAERELENPKKALVYQQNSAEISATLYGMASEKHLEALDNTLMILQDIGEREEFEGTLDILGLCEEYLGEIHPKTIQYRQSCIAYNMRETEEDFELLLSMVEEQWEALELPATTDLSQESEENQRTCADLIVSAIDATLELEDESLQDWMDLAASLEEQHSFLFISRLNAMYTLEDWSGSHELLKKLVPHYQDDEEIVDMIHELLEDLEENQNRKAIKNLKKWIRNRKK